MASVELPQISFSCHFSLARIHGAVILAPLIRERFAGPCIVPPIGTEQVRQWQAALHLPFQTLVDGA
jgi:hypothetical protein